jgi:cytochrome c peroxidase
MAKVLRYIPLAVAAILAASSVMLIASRLGTPADAGTPQHRSGGGLNEKELLGKEIYYDATLSSPPGMACATCHRPEVGFADTLHRMTSEGIVHGRFSNRNSMSAAYTAFVPELHYNAADSTWVGGLFWDGRAKSLADQASKPFTNPLEMACSNDIEVVEKVRRRPYFQQIMKLYGNPSGDEEVFAAVTDLLATYESSYELNTFSSKFDAVQEGKAAFTAEEARGFELFKNKGKCANCHIVTPDPKAGHVLFTDFTYDNLGIPRNMKSGFLRQPKKLNPSGRKYIDLGLGEIVHDPAENGKFRVPTLRNIYFTAPYGHNGYFTTLEDIVHFYNVRDDGHSYPPPAYPATVNHAEMGNLGLSAQDEADIVAFLKTLSDNWKP